jgi:hypothetical protein
VNKSPWVVPLFRFSGVLTEQIVIDRKPFNGVIYRQDGCH